MDQHHQRGSREMAAKAEKVSIKVSVSILSVSAHCLSIHHIPRLKHRGDTAKMPPNGNHADGASSGKTVGYIGLGNAGFSMASNFPKAGYHLVVHDADVAKAERAASEWQNTTASQGRSEAFAQCEVIITMLPQGKIVREVLLGKEGIAKALKPGRCDAKVFSVGIGLRD